jgi:hypothetical protein
MSMNKTVGEFTGLKVVEMREHLGLLGVRVGSRATKDVCVTAYANWLEANTTSAGQVPAPEPLPAPPEVVYLNTGGENVLVAQPKGRGDEVRVALRDPALQLAVRDLKNLPPATNRAQRRKAEAIRRIAMRKLSRAGLTLEEVLAV